jgi:hypothetical protein
MALISPIVNAYRQMGQGTRVVSSFSQRLFHLAAVIYVDDTNLLHWPSSPCIDPDKLVEHVQLATLDYGHLAIASGGILKEKKCSVYLLDYKYTRRCTQMELLSNLPAPRCYIAEDGKMLLSHILIPQPECPDLPLVTHDIHTASKILGVHFSPARNSTTHVNNMVQKGLDWVDCLRTKPVCRNDAWLSFYLQLFPALSWGLVTVCMPPKKFNAKFQWVHEKALPFLSVNCKIKQEWRTLPEQYQGSGMPNMPLLAIQVKLSFLLSNWGLTSHTHSKALAMAYGNFLLKIGLYRSPLQWQYDEYGTLSVDAAWFHNLWQLVSLYGMEMCFCLEDNITGIWENDCSLVAKFYQIGYQGKCLEA